MESSDLMIQVNYKFSLTLRCILKSYQLPSNQNLEATLTNTHFAIKKPFRLVIHFRSTLRVQVFQGLVGYVYGCILVLFIIGSSRSAQLIVFLHSQHGCKAEEEEAISIS